VHYVWFQYLEHVQSVWASALQMHIRLSEV
jgi:hypothetical protein